MANYKIGKFVLSRNTHNSKNHLSGTHRLDTIRSFFHHAVETFLIPKQTKNSSQEILEDNNGLPKAKETYWCSEYLKCHAIIEKDHIFCALYTSSVTTHTMRIITKKTLKLFLSDKQVCW